MSKEVKNKSFHESIGPVLTFGQFFAMLPVNGILSNNEDNLRFQWTSIRTIYSIIFLIFGSIESCLAVRRLFVIGFSIGYAESILFYVLSMVRSVMIFRLAIKWKSIMMYWKEREDVFLRKPYVMKKFTLRFKLTIFFGFIAGCVIVEHLFFLAYAIHSNYIQIKYCNPKSKIFWDNFLARYRSHVRHFVAYSPWQLPFYEWVNLLQAFAFSYADIFIMLLSISITTRFNQYNHLFRKIIANKDIEYKPTIWRDLRVHYIQLLELTKFIDSHISGVILISASHNMLTVILKCFFAFRPTRIDFLDTIYFWFFMAFLITRTFLVLYLPALINEAAFRPLAYIRQIPQDKWSSDMERLHDIISTEAPSIAFTGNQFFYITKGTILSMIGTIITFEIILLDEFQAPSEGLCASID